MLQAHSTPPAGPDRPGHEPSDDPFPHELDPPPDRPLPEPPPDDDRPPRHAGRPRLVTAETN